MEAPQQGCAPAAPLCAASQACGGPSRRLALPAFLAPSLLSSLRSLHWMDMLHQSTRLAEGPVLGAVLPWAMGGIEVGSGPCVEDKGGGVLTAARLDRLNVSLAILTTGKG